MWPMAESGTTTQTNFSTDVALQAAKSKPELSQPKAGRFALTF